MGHVLLRREVRRIKNPTPVREQHIAIYQTAADKHSNIDGNKRTGSTKTKKSRHLHPGKKRRFILTKLRISKKKTCFKVINSLVHVCRE